MSPALDDTLREKIAQTLPHAIEETLGNMRACTEPGELKMNIANLNALLKLATECEGQIEKQSLRDEILDIMKEAQKELNDINQK